MSARLVTTETVRGSVGVDSPLAKGESLVETLSGRHAPQALTTLCAKAFRCLAHGSSINPTSANNPPRRALFFPVFGSYHIYKHFLKTIDARYLSPLREKSV